MISTKKTMVFSMVRLTRREEMCQMAKKRHTVTHSNTAIVDNEAKSSPRPDFDRGQNDESSTERERRDSMLCDDEKERTWKWPRKEPV